uniref:Uncharacterized protein n=1 Tax=Anguilla anguilla TaxID=7936 RepID=A0A0E9X899_ANGAN
MCSPMCTCTMCVFEYPIHWLKLQLIDYEYFLAFCQYSFVCRRVAGLSTQYLKKMQG